MDAAVACVRRYGSAKTSMADIASAAGVTRRTVYAYFGSREEILAAAVEQAGAVTHQLALDMIRDLDDPADQLVEAVVTGIQAIREHPELSPAVVDESTGDGVRMMIAPDAIRVVQEGLSTISGSCPSFVADEDVAEVVIRWIVSFADLATPEPRDDDDLRALLHRTLVPALGLPPRRERAKRTA